MRPWSVSVESPQTALNGSRRPARIVWVPKYHPGKDKGLDRILAGLGVML